MSGILSMGLSGPAGQERLCTQSHVLWLRSDAGGLGHLDVHEVGALLPVLSTPALKHLGAGVSVPHCLPIAC